MEDRTRRGLLRTAASVGLLTVITPAEAAAPAAEKGKAPVQTAEKERVMSVGMTEAEAECWLLSAQAAGAFFSLPELHPMDRQEVAGAIHVLQNKLLSRPTYREYLEKARAEKQE